MFYFYSTKNCILSLNGMLFLFLYPCMQWHYVSLSQAPFSQAGRYLNKNKYGIAKLTLRIETWIQRSAFGSVSAGRGHGYCWRRSAFSCSTCSTCVPQYKAVLYLYYSVVKAVWMQFSTEFRSVQPKNTDRTLNAVKFDADFSWEIRHFLKTDLIRCFKKLASLN